MPIDEHKADRIRESLRTGMAKALSATAQGLATASKAAASTASQLRPPEPASPDGNANAPSASESPQTPTVGTTDLDNLSQGNARDVIASVSDLQASDLRRLRSIERDGKGRKTVLAAIDRALEA